MKSTYPKKEYPLKGEPIPKEDWNFYESKIDEVLNNHMKNTVEHV
jgi:hypothetical protein